MLKMIRPLYFFIAFAIGLFLVYIFSPAPNVVVKFPSPYNAGNIIYKDKHDSCYKYEAESVSCPVDKSRIKPQPLLEDFKQDRRKLKNK